MGFGEKRGGSRGEDVGFEEVERGFLFVGEFEGREVGCD